ncbi:flagellar biosynthesis protein FliQ [Spirochaeta africana]|uniref:Flagellar biosynthetic protein FliQ n=1 Tax=Spirochaeta africana (strain ATCC 700263 / DSM 8902 / Z-7692) TaxID=889378 RepID=U3GJS7_SPIAZ|nr:flagellar biosynthesis protein FliQ [Spirochaeta africana]AFG38136.1 flagellar biosynthetic protein FliQ [Spirochaeta africana DSM 8902]
MNLGFVILLVRTSVLHILMLAAPILLIGMGVGLIVSIFQATTSIQEQTLTFVPKIVAILVVLILAGPWMFATLQQFTVTLFMQIPSVVQ